MTKIRLLRMGRHKSPFFRLVVADQRAKSNGAYIELVGQYNPLDGTMSVDEYTAIKWLASGAQPSDTAKSVLKQQGVWAKFNELKQTKQLEAYLEANAKAKKQPAKKEDDEAKKLEAEKKRQELKRLADERAKKEAEEKAKRLAEQKAKDEEKARKEAEALAAKKAAEEKAKKEAEERAKKLVIKEDSKAIKKISEEELAKREKQEFVVDTTVTDADTSAKTIMISLDKTFIEEIINEEKEIIFFKKLPVQKVQRVLVYSIKPIGMVVGEFDLKNTQVLSKTKSWREYGSKSILTKKQFDAYFKDQDDVKLMELDGFIPYKNPRPLDEFKLTKGPSGFCYLK